MSTTSDAGQRGSGTLSASAVNSLIRSVKAFSRWLAEEELVERDPFSRVKAPKVPRLVKPHLSAQELIKVLATARSNRNAYRNEAVILFILDTGARAAEVCGLRADAIDWSIGIARLYGKGQKERYVPFSAHTAKAMQRYGLRERRGEAATFFQSEEGDSLTKSGLYQICRRISDESGVHVAPHKLRHTFAISYLRAGGNAFALQKLLGHTTLHTTLTYVAMTSDDLVAEHRQHSPVDAMLRKRRSVRQGVSAESFPIEVSAHAGCWATNEPFGSPIRAGAHQTIENLGSPRWQITQSDASRSQYPGDRTRCWTWVIPTSSYRWSCRRIVSGAPTSRNSRSS